MSSYRSENLPEIPISSSVTMRVIPGENSTTLLARLAKRGKVASHKHVHEQVSYIVKGAIKVSVADSNPREYVVREGEVSVIPPNVEHELSALEDTTLVDVFSPRRDDLLKYTKKKQNDRSTTSP